MTNQTNATDTKKPFTSRPKNETLEAYKEWIMGIARHFNPEAQDDLTPEQWEQKWKRFWKRNDPG